MIKQPSYRFAGYTEPWEQKKLGEIIERGGSGGTPKSTNNDFYGGEIPFLSISDISNSGKYLYKTEKTITQRGLENSSAWLVPKGSISLAMYASVGKLAILGIECATSQAFYNMVISNESTKNFIFTILEKANLFKEWKSLISTGTQDNLNAQKVKNFIIPFPSFPEQTAIGSFFQDIDQLISLQQHKLEVLKEQKKTYLKLLFPAKGQTKPALRFAGFEDEWKEVKLGEVTYIKTGGRDVQDSVEDGLYPFYIRSEEVKRINSYSFDGEAILIPGEGRLGEIFHYANGKFDVHQRVYKISNFTDVNAKFVLQQMKKDFKQHAMRNTVKATVDSLRLPTIQSFNILVPSLPEQTAIGSFFQDLDKAIAKQEEKVNQLKESKQTLLRKMFI